MSARRVAVLAALVAGCAATQPAPAPAPEPIVNDAPATAGPAPCLDRPPTCLPDDLAIVDLVGTSYRRADLEGRPVILTFWATWAKPSAAEIPVFNQLVAEHAELLVVGILADDIEDAGLRRYLIDHAIEYPIVRLDRALTDAFGYPQAVPRTLVYDPSGRLVTERTGTFALDELRTILAGM